MIRAITFQCPDRAPIQHWAQPGAYMRHGSALLELFERYPDDFDNEGVNPPEPASVERLTEVREWRDAWGTLWHGLKGFTSGEVKVPAIPDWSRWSEYQFPPLPEPSYFEWFRAKVERRHPKWFVLASGGTLFQQMISLRGMTNLLMDLAEDRPEVHELADRLVEYRLAHIKRYLETQVDAIEFADDWGAQDRMLIHPELWRNFFKPRYKRLFEPVKEAGRFIWFHTDGWTLDILEDLIELGIDVLNPEHDVMGDERVAKHVAGRVCIKTNIDTQYLLPRGSPDEIRAYVKKLLVLFGNYNGGIILHGEIGPDVPLENVQALFSAFYEFGSYPFHWIRGEL